MSKKGVLLPMGICFLVASVVSASAGGRSGDQSSHAGTANVWNTENAIGVTYSDGYPGYPIITGNQVDLYLKNYSIGLPSSYSTSYTRWAFFEVYENDLIYPDVFAKSYQTLFTTVNGYYRPSTNTTLTNYSSNQIEDDGKVELYMKYFITTCPGDSDTSIPASLIRYYYETI